jgi:hypothetical protein
MSAGCPFLCGGHRNLEPGSTSPDDQRRSCKSAKPAGISISLEDRHAPRQPNPSCAERPTPSRRWPKAGLMEVGPTGEAWLAMKKDPSSAISSGHARPRTGKEGARPPKNKLARRRRRPNRQNNRQIALRSHRRGSSALPLFLASLPPAPCRDSPPKQTGERFKSGISC